MRAMEAAYQVNHNFVESIFNPLTDIPSSESYSRRSQKGKKEDSREGEAEGRRKGRHVG